MRIALVTDAWKPQRNGVVRVLTALTATLEAMGHPVKVFEPGAFPTLPCPSYPEIPLALFPSARLGTMLEAFAPEALHIATEGPLGWAARRWCLARRLPFTTAYHTKFPDYVTARTGLPLEWGYAAMRRFHQPAVATLCPSPSVYQELRDRGFAGAVEWSHGVDTEVFRPRGRGMFDLPRPVFLYVGRVAVEKNLPAFLELDLPGSKLVVGDGPARAELIRRYPTAHFRIVNGDEELARAYSDGDVFVFPSRTDTFGLVMLEALACGIPVAAFPVTGPRDVVEGSGVGILSEDLAQAARTALTIPGEACRAHAASFSWVHVATQFLARLCPFGSAP